MSEEEQVIDESPETEEPARPEGAAMEDTIRETYRKLTSEGDGGSTRDAAGRFASRTGAAESAPAAAPEGTAGPENGGAPQGDDGLPAGIDTTKAPSTWRKEAAAAWATLPLETRHVLGLEMQKRERDFSKGIETFKEYANFANDVVTRLKPYAEIIRREGGDPAGMIQSLFETSHILYAGTPDQKVGLLRQLAHQFGVAGAFEPQQQPPSGQEPDLRVMGLERTVQELQNVLQQRIQQEELAQQANAANEVAQFSKDTSRVHLAEVRGEMASLLRSGICQTLAEAYERAIWSVPEVRAKVVAEQQQSSAKAAADRAAEAKKAASVNVQRRGSLPGVQPVGTMEDTIRQTYRKLTGT